MELCKQRNTPPPPTLQSLCSVVKIGGKTPVDVNESSIWDSYPIIVMMSALVSIVIYRYHFLQPIQY